MNIVDPEFEEYSIQLIHSVNTMLFGRVTYQLMESYWPEANPKNDDPRIVEAMNNYPKMVLSKTLKKVDWKNSTILRGEATEEVKRLKEQPGGDIIVYGSGSIVDSLTGDNLIDDYRIFFCPLLLGKGKRMFGTLDSRFHFKLVDSRMFKSGLVLLHYVKR